MRYSSLVASIFLIPIFAHGQDPGLCQSLLKDGLYDSSSSSVKVTQISTAIQHLCMSTAQTSSEARAIGATVGVPDLPVVLGYNEADNNFSTFKLQLCSSYFSNNQSYVNMNQAVSRVTDGAAAIISACGGMKGVQAYVYKNFPPDNDFIVVVKYEKPAGGAEKTRISLSASRADCGPPKLVSHGATANFLCSMTQDANSTLLALDSNPQVDMIVPTLRYSTVLPELPQRHQSTSGELQSTVEESAVLDTGAPGPTKIIVEGSFGMNGTHNGPSSILTIYLDGVADTSCKPEASGKDGPQATPYHCEFKRFLPYGSVQVRVRQAASNGDPSFVKMTATAVPISISPAYRSLVALSPRTTVRKLDHSKSKTRDKHGVVPRRAHPARSTR